jgi:hypothetical protein
VNTRTLRPLPPVLLIQFFASSAMAAVIWVVQIVIYPQFSGVGAAEFHSYHEHYMSRITWIVGPLMILELGTASLAALLCLRIRALKWASLSGLALVIFLWAITALVQVPLHEQLSRNGNDETIALLVDGNWPRTILWTLRAILAGALLHVVLIRREDLIAPTGPDSTLTHD